MPTDAEIARDVTLKPIHEIAQALGLSDEDLIPYGRHKAKVHLAALERPRERPGKGRLILVSGITPTPAGEGKTTTCIGLAQAMHGLGASACLALREPSLGPCMGMKGGATGGGRSQIGPADSINLHFNGDFHAVSSAHNLLAAMVDNTLHFRGETGIDPRRVVWKRVVDMNDRSLRNVVIGLGGPGQGVPRESGFTITAASEVMAILCLAEGYEDLRARLDRVVVAYDRQGAPVTAGRIGVTGAMLALLHDALLPNLVQTLDGSPALVHGGPFANIAHGCSSVLATRMALHYSDWAITEAGFGFDLGGEKFFDIKCRQAGFDTAAVVLVATVRALKMHGGRKKSDLDVVDADAVSRGIENLEKHVENIRAFGERPIVALNRFASDDDAEVDVVARWCDGAGVPFAISDHHARGGEGAADLARLVMRVAESDGPPFKPVYSDSQSVAEKIRAVATRVYGAGTVEFDRMAQREIAAFEKMGYGHLPVCIAKTQYSFSDKAALRGRPRDFEVNVRSVSLNAGAGFIVVITGDILRMPGLPREPQALDIDVTSEGIVGIS